MEIAIQKELKEMCKIAKYLADDTLQAYIEYSSMYCKEAWLLFHSEFLRRMELQIQRL